MSFHGNHGPSIRTVTELIEVWGLLVVEAERPANQVFTCRMEASAYASVAENLQRTPPSTAHVRPSVP